MDDSYSKYEEEEQSGEDPMVEEEDGSDHETISDIDSDSDESSAEESDGTVMGRTRFEEIFVCWRFDDKSTRKERFLRSGDKLEPVREIYDEIVKACIENYSPSENLTVDERLALFKGHCPFRVYMRDKPGKFGIKVWCCACCETHYIVNFQIYTGKTGNAPEKNQGKRVVTDLVGPFTGSWREVTSDNFFTSSSLAEDLWNKETVFTGTVRANKAFIPPNFLVKKDREASFMRGYNNQSVLVSNLESTKKKPVVILTTNTNVEGEPESSGVKPPVVLHYNHTKGAVDTGDYITRHHSLARKTRCWTKKIIMEMISICTLNSSVLFSVKYSWFSKRSASWRGEYLELLANELVKDHINDRLQDSARLPKTLKSGMERFLKQAFEPYLEDEEKLCHVCQKELN
ncbi:piggyBac transposable element-derived protein 4-like [Culex pipiens pallens]|uniref:piggyBac transposable element-derived protein 4-like n=1 Tax=Culex pipiens pallens TaxID=42434 RepID=UPI0019531CD8|nr:piggyBac transposable element-derived protein 4-like [Culex pipiens pallens]